MAGRGLSTSTTSSRSITSKRWVLPTTVFAIKLRTLPILDYQTNIFISDRAPELYVDEFRTKLGEEGYKKTCAENALPENFENMPYDQFLAERRKLMAGIIKKAYLKLCE